MNYKEIDTPALLIDQEILLANLNRMQDYANEQKVALRPHTKTHKMPYIARIQKELGAKGITVAKVGEAEVMAENGLDDIFVANQIVGEKKLQRLRKLAQTNTISFGVDSICQVEAAHHAFEGSEKPARLVVEIEVGERRSGIIEEEDFIALINAIKDHSNVEYLGVFSHEGHCYSAETPEDCQKLFDIAVNRTLAFADLAEANGLENQVISIGSTPSLILDFPINERVTEIRPGTYTLMDASQGNVIQTTEHCAATIYTTVISRPTDERVITDVGAKGLTAQRRTEGICATPGLGTVKGWKDVYVHDVYDEHAIFYNKHFRDNVEIGDKIEIIPVHICPVCNLYDNAYLISEGKVVDEIPVLCRGKLT